MDVPTPPSTQDFTTIEYSGSDGATNFTIGTVKPSGDTYSVEIKTSQTGNALQSDYGTKVVAQAGEKVNCTLIAEEDYTKPNGTYKAVNGGETPDFYITEIQKENLPEGAEAKNYMIKNSNGSYVQAKDLNGEGPYYEKKSVKEYEDLDGAIKSSYTGVKEERVPTNISEDELNNYFVVVDGKTIELNSSNADKYLSKNSNNEYTFKDGFQYYAKDAEGDVTLTNPNAGKITVGGNVVYTFDEAEEMYGDRFSWADYKEAIINTFGKSNESLDADDFYLYVHTSETGVDSIKFALRSDVGERNAEGTLVGDGFAKTYSYTPNGTFTSSTPTEGCRLQFDTQGRITTVSIPQYDTENNIIGYRDVELTAKTSTDEKAYQDAYNQYEYKQYEYDKAQQDVNRKTEIIQQEDRNLELKLQRLDNERTQITTEIEAVEKVIQENIESSYKTFSG